MTHNTPIKVSSKTHQLIKLGASISDMTMERFVDNAVRDYLKAHRKEIEEGIEYSKIILGLIDET